MCQLWQNFSSFVYVPSINLYVFSRSDKIEVSFFRPGKEEGGWIYLQQTNILDMPHQLKTMNEVIFSKEERWWVKKKLVELSPLVLIDVTGCWLTVNSALVKEAALLQSLLPALLLPPPVYLFPLFLPYIFFYLRTRSLSLWGHLKPPKVTGKRGPPKWRWCYYYHHNLWWPFFSSSSDQVRQMGT